MKTIKQTAAAAKTITFKLYRLTYLQDAAFHRAIEMLRECYPKDTTEDDICEDIKNNNVWFWPDGVIYELAESAFNLFSYPTYGGNETYNKIAETYLPTKQSDKFLENLKF